MTSMKKIGCALCMVALIGSLSIAAQAAGPSGPPGEDDALYTLGVNVGQQLHQNGVGGTIPLNRLQQGVKDGLAGKLVLPADQMRLNAFLRASAEAAAVHNSGIAREFLARNAKVPGVVTTPSGLQYEIIEAGDAAAVSPKPTDQVTVSFHGKLLDGHEFDSSSKPGTASDIQVNGVMKAWTEALSQMKPGAKWRLWVSPDLGFGQQSRPGIPGGSLLIYELQLMSVTPGARAQPS